MKYELKSKDMEMTDAIRDHLDKSVSKLDKFYNNITNAHFDVGMISHHHHKGKIFRAEGNLNVPGKLLRAESTNEDLYHAIDEMVSKLKRELITYKETH
jgi:putative sigma-54 modulation protein